MRLLVWLTRGPARFDSALIATLCAWLASGTVALAELPQLDWRAPPGCPDAASVEEALARAADPGAQQAVRAVRARVVATGEGYALALTLATAEHTHHKRLSAKLCSTFVDLLALELGFAALPSAPRVEPAPPHAEYVWAARASGVVGTGPVPGPAAGAALALALSTRRLRLELGATYLAPRIVRYAVVKDVGARFDAIAGEARACYLQPVRRVLLPFCAGAELGVLHGRGLGPGVESASAAWRLFAGLFVAPALHFPVAGPVWGWAEVAGSLLLVRPRFGVRNLTQLYRPDRLALRGALGLVVRFN